MIVPGCDGRERNQITLTLNNYNSKSLINILDFTQTESTSIDRLAVFPNRVMPTEPGQTAVAKENLLRQQGNERSWSIHRTIMSLPKIGVVDRL